jgi:hypothetical protein
MGTRVRMGLMAGVRAPEEQIEKDQHSYSNRPKEIPVFFPLHSEDIYSLIRNYVELPLAGEVSIQACSFHCSLTH